MNLNQAIQLVNSRIQFSNLSLVKDSVIENDVAFYLPFSEKYPASQHFSPRFLNIIVDRNTSEIFDLKIISDPYFELGVYYKWKKSNGNQKFPNYRVEAQDQFLYQQQKFEEKIRKSQKIELFFSRKVSLYIGDRLIDKFNLSNIHIIGFLCMKIPDKFLYDTWAIMISKKKETFWVSVFADGYRKLESKLIKRSKGNAAFGVDVQFPSHYNQLLWPRYFEGKKIGGIVEIFEELNFEPQNSFEMLLAENYMRYPLNGKFSEWSRKILNST